ncbi:hypothetical protein GCM10009127_00140 [Alteraurantiacibacter aestuarii]|uniref:Cupin domain-containing protein n=1 Tax=Alteraurantiacibacter aestuarii TaxID=650004 RepID=A0A844ZLT4_9SPHN|nr:cupin domain-containing protein [Alteraurantiacibacter aestuarii]MXO88728.1 cupin domain-containing protein [Alteraurantiacibacter aestuarii]
MRTIFLAAMALTACSQEQAPVPQPEASGYRPPIGSNEIFRGEPGAAPGHELIVTDLLLGPDAVGATHYHPWEEYLYVIEGSAKVDVADLGEGTLVAGQSFIIPAQAVHTPRAGPDGVRAIIIRVHNEGEPTMVPVDQ